MMDYIPPLLQKEKQAVRQAIEGKDVSFCFDETSRLGEALAIVIRYSSEWTIKQKLVRLSMLAKFLRGEEVAQEVLSALSTELGIPSQKLLAFMRDCASVNSVAVTTLSGMYPSAMDIGCFSHYSPL